MQTNIWFIIFTEQHETNPIEKLLFGVKLIFELSRRILTVVVNADYFTGVKRAH